MSQTFTRQELYDLVWSTPISNLAAKYGLSDRGLAKICGRHHIPVPGRGHWARVEAGQKTTKTPLWKVDNPAIQQVTIGANDHLRPAAAFAKEVTRKVKGDRKAEARASGQTATADRVVELRDVGTSIHPSLGVFARELHGASADRDGGIKYRGVRVHRDSISRVLTLLNTLAFELEPLGIRFSGSNSRISFVQGQTSIGVGISGAAKRVPAPRGSWRISENIFTGSLALQLYADAQGVKKNWIDKDGIEFEKDLAKLISSIHLCLAVEAKVDERREKDRKLWLLEAHRGVLEERRHEREKARKALLKAIARDRREILNLTETISFLPSTPNPSPEFTRMIEWAKARLAKLEARTTPAAIQLVLEEGNLFPDPDELADPGDYEE